MAKKIYIIIGLFTVIMLAAGIYFYISQPKSASQPAASQNSDASPPSTNQSISIIPGKKPGDENTFNIETDQGSINVNNFYKLSGAQSLSEDGVNFKNSSYYYMAYYPNQQGFIISILDANIEGARQIAENDFLQALGITKDQACKLNVSLTVSPEASERASGGNYRLSFCSNGKPFSPPIKSKIKQ
jgi:hypothetical protein